MVISPLSFIGAAFFPGSSFSATLKTYFRSGWAFFIPYLAAYLLYAGLDWPVNPLSPELQPPTTGLLPPSLLHVYWVLHAIHMVLGFVALASNWRGRYETKNQRVPGNEDGQPRPDLFNSPPPASGDHLHTTRFSLLDTLPKAAPWLLLGLLFYIPGIYLEWPSDPWEHLRRINEWHSLEQVTAHSSWKKSSYFLPYSLTGHTTGFDQISLLNLYYTGVCLLLSWQYYLLARAAGLGVRSSFVFVLLNGLTFGNNIFSFYRYYSLSSSIFAQIGAVALIRVALDMLRPRRGEHVLRNGRQWFGENWSLARRLVISGPAVSSLVALIAFNHIQGFGIAGLGVLAVLVWRLIEWKRAMLFWMVGAAVVLSIAVVLWFPRNPALDNIYRPQGWLNGWYGFDFFSLSSPTFDRTLHILGFLGIANVFLGFWLVVQRNDIAGWLQLTPFIILMLPCFALPVTSLLASESSVENIVTFHRLLLAAPLPLALVVTGAGVARVGGPRNWNTEALLLSRTPLLALPGRVNLLMVVVGLLGLVSLPADDRSFNRFWHAIQITPMDLQLGPYITTVAASDPVRQLPDDVMFVDTPLAAETQEAFLPKIPSHQFRQIHTVDRESVIVSRIEQLANTLISPAFRYIDSTGEYEKSPANILIRLAVRPAVSQNQLVADLTTTNSRWLTLGGHAHRTYQREGKLVLGNAPGTASHVFNVEMIPVQAGKRYLLSATIRQTNGTGTNYLAVAWYDQAGRLLVASEPAPKGAGSPLGWAAGTYSYYGLVNQTADPEWTRYSISFGLGEIAAIPRNATFMRTGALLNETHTPNSSAEFTELILQEKPGYRQVWLAAPDFRTQFTSGSQAAWLSGHWSPQHLAAQQMGTGELRALFGGGYSPTTPLNPVSD